MTSRWQKRTEEEKAKILREQELKGAVPTAKIDNPFSPKTLIPPHLRKEAQEKFMEKWAPDTVKIEGAKPKQVSILGTEAWDAAIAQCTDVMLFCQHFDPKDEPPEVVELVKRMNGVYFKRRFIIQALKTFLAPGGMIFNNMAKENPSPEIQEAAKKESFATGQAFKLLHVSDLQICPCSDMENCINCKDVLQFLKDNYDIAEVNRYIAGRVFPVGWHDIPAFKVMKEVFDKNMKVIATGRCPKCDAPIRPTNHGPHCEYCGNHIDYCVCSPKKPEPINPDRKSPCCGVPVIKDSFGEDICSKCFINLGPEEMYK